MMYSKISSGIVSMNEGSVMVTQESRVTVFACRGVLLELYYYFLTLLPEVAKD